MSLELVQQVKATLVAAGEDLSGPCGAFKIVHRVVWALRDQGAGFLHKRPEQNGCALHGDRYGVDIVMYQNGLIIDCLFDAGGENTPLWQEKEFVDPSLFRHPFDPEDAPVPVPTPPSEPPTPPTDLTPILARLDALEAKSRLLEAKLEASRIRIEALELTPFPKLEVVGSTGRSWSHAHGVKLNVTVKE